MKNNMKKAFAEVEQIIEHSEKSVKNNIPQKLKDFLSKNKDKDYIVNIDFSKKIEEQELLPETKQLIALIYRDFLCSKFEKEVIEKNEANQKTIIVSGD